MEKYHAKHKSLKMETVKAEEFYAITISPPDLRTNTELKNEVQGEITLLKQIQQHKEYFKKKLKHCKLDLFPELSPTGRLHYHGYIQITNVLNFYWYDLYYLQHYAMFEIDTINGETGNKYREYITKQSNLFEPLFDKHGYKWPIKI